MDEQDDYQALHNSRSRGVPTDSQMGAVQATNISSVGEPRIDCTPRHDRGACPRGPESPSRHRRTEADHGPADAGNESAGWTGWVSKSGVSVRLR